MVEEELGGAERKVDLKGQMGLVREGKKVLFLQRVQTFYL